MHNTPVIQIKNLVKTYQTGGDIEVKAVRGINLDIQYGEFVAIMGASGSGKSTLMNMLGCLDTPTNGTYTLHGQDVCSVCRCIQTSQHVHQC